MRCGGWGRGAGSAVAQHLQPCTTAENALMSASISWALLLCALAARAEEQACPASRLSALRLCTA
jgi:hypothetical protein